MTTPSLLEPFHPKRIAKSELVQTILDILDKDGGYARISVFYDEPRAAGSDLPPPLSFKVRAHLEGSLRKRIVKHTGETLSWGDGSISVYHGYVSGTAPKYVFLVGADATDEDLLKTGILASLDKMKEFELYVVS
jgi:hypothetical protein